MALIISTLAILTMLVLFSLIFDTSLLSSSLSVGIDNTALINGSATTFIVETENVIFSIDTSNLINAGIALLFTVIAVALIVGVQVLGSGLNVASAKIYIIITAYIGIWSVLSLLAFTLINSIQVFGSIIYIALTLAYTVGVVQKISGSGID